MYVTSRLGGVTLKRSIMVAVFALALIICALTLIAPTSTSPQSIYSLETYFNTDPSSAIRFSGCYDGDIWPVELGNFTCPSDRHSHIASSIRVSPRRVIHHSDTSSLCSCQGSVDAGMCYRDRGTLRCLPSFLIVGAMKSGTGALMKWLNYHPYIKSGRGKHGENEMHFFGSSASYDACSWLKYVKRFPDFGDTMARYSYTFDKSPDYIRDPMKLKQIAAMLPSAKLILLVRNPTSRAYSGFQHNCRHRRYRRLLHSLSLPNVTVPAGDIYNILDPQFQRVSDEHAETLQFPCTPQDFHRYIVGSKKKSCMGSDCLVAAGAKFELSYGHYADQLGSALQNFDRKQIKVLFQEDMIRNTTNMLEEVQRFLGLPCFDFSKLGGAVSADGNPAEQTNSITTSFKRRPDGMLPKTAILLDEYFEARNQRFGQMMRRHYDVRLPNNWPVG